LFSLLGTNFGGNGTTTFGLPDMKGTVAISQGNNPAGSSYVIGETGGMSTVALGRDQSPVHTHALRATSTVGTTNGPAGNVLARPQVTGSPKNTVANLYNTNPPDTVLNAPISPAGNGQTHDNLQPFLVLNYCICLRGIFPQRE
jgi:microcystin-dependent protein